MGERQAARIKDVYLPVLCSGVAHRGTRAAAICAVIYGEDYSRVFYQKTVSCQHTAVIIVPTDVNDGICLFQNRASSQPSA